MRNKRFKFWITLLAATIGLIAVVTTVLYFTRPMAKVVVAIRGKAIDAVPGSVAVDAGYEMDLKSEIGGRVIKSALDEGKHVKEGEFLVQLDTGDLKLDIEKLENDYDALKKRIAVGSQIQLSLESAQTDFANTERIHKLGQISDNDFEKQRRALKALQQSLDLEKVNNQNQLDSDENALKAKRRELDKMTITAPFDGVISKVLTHPGDLIGGGAPIATIISTSRKVEAHISEENFAGIKVGQPAQVRFLTYGDQTYAATVTKILPTADPATQRYTVYLNVDMPIERLIPGLTGEVSIIVGQRDDALIVPRRALSGNSLYVVRRSQVQLRNVTLGYIGLNQAEILDGVGEGEKVIVEDLDRFNKGDHVRYTILPQ